MREAWPPPRRGKFAQRRAAWRELERANAARPMWDAGDPDRASVIQDRPRPALRLVPKLGTPDIFNSECDNLEDIGNPQVDNVKVITPPIPFGGQWEAPPIWAGQKCFVVASGPSISEVDFSLIAGRNIIAVNSAYEMVPQAQWIFFGDGRWWEEHKRRLVNFPGHIVTVSGVVKSKRLLRLHRMKPVNAATGFSAKPDTIASQRTSLQGGLNLAAHFGVSEIGLLGADMGRAADGRSHGHPPHKWKNRPGNVTWDEQMMCLKWIVSPLKRRGIKVFNLNPASRIPWWPKMTLQEYLAKGGGK